MCVKKSSMAREEQDGNNPGYVERGTTSSAEDATEIWKQKFPKTGQQRSVQ